jgi:hypothetical protein
VSSTVYADIAMDFAEGFPHINGKSVILTMVDRFSKYMHADPYTTTSVACAFFNDIM